MSARVSGRGNGPRRRRPQGAGQGGRAGARARLRRVLAAVAALVLAAALAAPLAACGKKGDVKPPPGSPDEFPRTYPSE